MSARRSWMQAPQRFAQRWLRHDGELLPSCDHGAGVGRENAELAKVAGIAGAAQLAPDAGREDGPSAA